MSEIALPNNGPVTSRLGFGCARVFGGLWRQASLRVLNTALDSGIRHFDVAPYYGLGSAEAVVGSFLASHRGQVTVTTKFGLHPPFGKRLFRAVRTALRPVRPELPHALLRLARRLTPPPAFKPADLTTSLHTSLRNLRCERIDVLLLHEAWPHDLTDELVSALGRAVSAGYIGSWGIGSERSRLDQPMTSWLHKIAVLQHEWSVMSADLAAASDTFVITHRALSGAIGAMTVLLADQDRTRRWSEAVSADLADRRVLAQLLLAAALHKNAGGIVLFSSSDPGRVRDNAAASALTRHAGIARFIALAAAERHMIAGFV